MAPSVHKTKSSFRYVAAFRTYAWDEGIAELARRFFAAVPSARQVVLVDETRGSVEIPGYEKVSHTAETAYLGLPNHPPGRSLWFNVDYGVYILQKKFPKVDYFLLSESDLAVNLSLEPMMDFVTAHHIDLIAHRVWPSHPAWYWHSHGVSLSANPWMSHLYFMVLSRRAIARLMAARRRLARRFAAGKLALWPFCEAFVPTVLKSVSGMRIADVSTFVLTDNLNFRPWLSIHDPRANRPGSLAHSVLGGKQYIRALLSTHPARDFFEKDSALRRALLSQAPFEDIVTPLRRALARARDYKGIRRLEKEALAGNWIPDLTTDLAFCKPAVTSSVSPFSRYQDPELDASGANGDLIPYDYGFHTQKELNPWWMVDLLDESAVEEIAIVNRRTQPYRFTAFTIESSCDGIAWTTRFEQAQPGEVSADAESPWRLRFNESFPARYLRVVLSGIGPLHLRRVQVLGRTLAHRRRRARSTEPVWSGCRWPLGPLTDLAFGKPAVASSTSRYSWNRDPETDARGANRDVLVGDYAFHTQKEPNPWWMVDLLGESMVEEVAIVNRRNHPHRLRTFRIETSCDGEAWTTRFEQVEPIEVSSDIESPWRARFAEPFPARYLRLIVLGFEPLHLRRVQVMGRVSPREGLSSRMATPAQQVPRWPYGPLTDLAFGKPAVTSSVSPYSLHQDPELDACGANSGVLPTDYGFHTQKELNPWWMVDLLTESKIEEVAIVNRRNQPHRFRTFCIESSSDGDTWTTRFKQTEPLEVSTDVEAPWRLRFSEPFLARYVRIILLGIAPLHLRSIQVFGRVRPERRTTSGA